MDRREAGEELYRQKFAQLGLAKKFELVGRDWASDHGRKMTVKCKACGAVFSIWDEVLKGRQKHMLCKECGNSSGEKTVKARSPKVDEAMKYYTEGHSVRETASVFGFSMSDINNLVKRRRLTNGQDWQKSGAEAWSKKAASLFVVSHRSEKKHHRGRAKLYGCEYDPSVTLRELVERNGLRCAICGEMCDPSDHSWSKYTGPKYPSIDHIIPMSKGGGHTWDNVQVAHIICNSAKGDSSEEVSA